MKQNLHHSRRHLLSLSGGFCALAISALAFLPGPGYAQDDDNGEEQGINGFWEVELDGGRFVVRLDTISSVSQHQYLVDGARVYEVTVDTTGSQAARFYYLEPATDGGPLTMAKTALERAKDLAKTATERTGTDAVWDEVIKTYPDTTHARTAEYRLQDIDVLNKIYNHIHRVWAEERGKGKSNKLRIVTPDE